jgi:hypothetical protein
MKRIAFLAALAAACTGTCANAVVVFLDSVTQEGSNYRFTYAAAFSDGEGVKSGSTLAVFDFKGYVPGSIRPANASLRATTPNSSNMMVLGYTDDAAVPNLVFKYSGPMQTMSNQRFVFGSALSRFGNTALDGFSAITVKTMGATGTLVGSQGAVGVPAPGVPEPASWALMIGGFGLTGAALRRRKPVSALA